MIGDKDWRTMMIDEYGADAERVLVVLDDCIDDGMEPEVVWSYFELYLEHAERIPTEMRSFGHDQMALRLLMRLAECSRFGFDLACQHSRLFWYLSQEQSYKHVYGRSALDKELRVRLRALNDRGSRVRELVRFHQGHFLRLTLGDLFDCLSFESVTRELSDLADVLVQAALELAVERWQERFGQAECGFCVLAMGKLGGQELNYSSDLDFIFLYDQEGKTSGGRESIDHQSYFLRLGKELIRLLDERHSNGRLFRIDMRLRPEGNSGELALNYQSTVNYYYSKGRSWERQAMIKARPIAGDRALGDRLLRELRSWIYPQEQAQEDLDTAREMRQRIEERSQEANVKTGAGGIRDIEFLVQFFQLLYGGRHQHLQNRATLPTIRALADLSVITRSEAQILEEDYVWLRMVEHRLQMWEARQLHEVPEGEKDRRHLAIRCDFLGKDALLQFEQKHEEVRSRVRVLADKYYLSTTPYEDALFCLITTEDPAAALLDEVLGPIDFINNKRAHEYLRELAYEPFFVLSRRRTERRFLVILPTLLQLLTDSPIPDETLKNFVTIVRAVGGRSHFYEELDQQPLMLALLVSFAGWATFLVGQLERFPGLIDDLIERMDVDTDWDGRFMDEGRLLLQSVQDPGNNLAYLFAREQVRISLRDLQGESAENIATDLSMLARSVYALALEHCQNHLNERLGWPEKDGVPLRFSVLGLGKLGGNELSYASDMDVMYICDAGGTCTKKGKDAEYYWKRLIQDIAKLLGDGGIYEIDPRLRPWGEQGPMMSSCAALTRYWEQPREMWERLAMTRVSVLAGDRDLGNEAVAIIHQAALHKPLPEDAAQQVCTMRKRLEESCSGRDHVKRGYGGYVDIEFIVEYLSMTCEPGTIPPGEHMQRTLYRLHELGRIPQESLEDLTVGLELMRFVEARMRLSAGMAISSIPTDERERLALARRTGYTAMADLDLSLHLCREKTRDWFEHLVQ